MPDSKISALTSATTPLAGTEVLPIVQSGATKQVSVDNLTAGRNFSAGTITASLSGNATTATTLQTARTINGVSFNGSANITVPRVNAEDNRTAAPSAFTTDYATVSFGSWANNNTAPYADCIIFRTYVDASGGSDNMVTFNKSTIGMRIWQQTYGSATAFATYKDVAFTDSSITGNAATATALQNTRTLWGQNFNGSANVTGALTSVGNITGTAGVTLTATAGTLGLVATGANDITASTNSIERMRIDGSGNVGIGTTGALTRFFTAQSASSGSNVAFLFANTASTAFSQSTATVLCGAVNAIISANYDGSLNKEVRFGSSGTTTPVAFHVNGVERLRLTSDGNVHTPAGSTTMTDGFIYIPAAAGVPTGAATAITGTVPLYYNSSSNTLYAYNSSWQSISGGGLSLLSTNANGIVYLNGSSQATTSTALVFNGTEFGVGQSPSAGIQVDVTTTTLAQIRARATTNAVDSRLAASSTGLLGYTGTVSNHDFAFYANNAEKMRLTTGGLLGIGTSSPGGAGVHVANNAGGALFYASGAASGGNIAYLTYNSSNTANATARYAFWNDNGFSGDSANISFYSSGSSTPNELRITNGASAPITLYTNGSERLFISDQIRSSCALNYVQYNTSAGWADFYIATAAAGNWLMLRNFGTSATGTTEGVSNAGLSCLIFNNDAPGLIAQTKTSYPLLLATGGSERLRITPLGNIIDYQPTQSAQNTTATLTVAQLRTRIITANAAVTLTLPTAANLDTYTTGMPVNGAFDVTFIATAAAAITIAANGNTTVGSLTVAANTSGTYRFRKTAATPTFTVYRL